MPAIIVDIETAPLPWPKLEVMFKPPAKPGDFDPNTVKYGNMKDESKRAAKLEEAKTKHSELIAGWQSEYDKAKVEFIGKAALSAATGCVAAIGYFGLPAKDPGTRSGAVVAGVLAHGDEALEKARIEGFWRVYCRAKEVGDSIVGHNLKRFDVPFLVRRSWVLGVNVPGGVVGWYKGRASVSEVFVDTMEFWGCGVYGDSISLDNLGKALGLGGKRDDHLTGAQFAEWYYSGDPDKVKEAELYLVRDLELTRDVAFRLGIT